MQMVKSQGQWLTNSGHLKEAVCYSCLVVGGLVFYNFRATEVNVQMKIFKNSRLKSLLFYSLLLSLLSCAMNTKLKSLDLGMSETKVTESLGKPDGAKVDGNTKCLYYYNEFIGAVGEHGDYEVCFQEGSLTSYQAVNIRQSLQRENTTVLIQNKVIE